MTFHTKLVQIQMLFQNCRS